MAVIMRCTVLWTLLVLGSSWARAAQPVYIPLEPVREGGKLVNATLKWQGASCPRPFLILPPIGKNHQLYTTWLDDAEHRMFDIVALYYGKDLESFHCPECLAMYHRRAGKWRLFYLFTQTPVWQRVLDMYSYFGVPDDDLVMSTYVINAAFDISLHRNLSLSQPAVCKHIHSRAIWPNLLQRKGNLVRYVAHVEIQFPIFSRSLLRDTVIPARLDRASSGWGLDHVWPFLMDYPRDKIAVVDAVCMLHPTQEIQEGKESVYANRHPSGWSSVQEDMFYRKQFGVNPRTVSNKLRSYVHGTNWAEEPLPTSGLPLLNDTIECSHEGITVSPLGFRGPLTLAELANSLHVEWHNGSQISEGLLPWHHQDDEHLSKQEGYSTMMMQASLTSVKHLLVLTNALSGILVGTVVYRKIQKRSMARRWEGASKLRSGGSNSID